MFVADDCAYTRAAIDYLVEHGCLDVVFADNAFDGGRQVCARRPEVVVLSDSLGDLFLCDAVRIIRHCAKLERAKMICLTHSHLPPTARVDVCLNQQPDVQLLLSVVNKLLHPDPCS